MNPPGESDKLPDELDHAFNALKTLVNITQEVAGYLTKLPLPAEEPQPDRAQKFVDLFDQKRYCARLYGGLRDQCEYASRNNLIGEGHKSYFAVVLSECGRFLIAFHKLVEFAVSETVTAWNLRNRSLREELDRRFSASGRDMRFYRRIQRLAGMQCPVALGSKMNGPDLVGRPNQDVAAKHFAKALQSVKNVDGVAAPNFSPTLLADLRDELLRVATPPSSEPKEVPAPADQEVPEFIFGWGEITSVLKVLNDDTSQRRIRGFHDAHDSPIVFGGHGQPPMVDKHKLIAWWRGILERAADAAKQREEKTENANQTAKTGFETRSGETVISEMGGRKKNRRTPKSAG